MDIFTKIKFIWKKPKVVIITGEGGDCAKEAIFQVLKERFKIGSDLFIFALSNSKEIKFLIKNSSSPVLVVANIDAFPFDLVEILPPQGYLVLNFDDETKPSARGFAPRSCAFGFGQGADFRVSDIRQNSGTNFKINYQGNVVPVWLRGLFDKEHIYAALAGAAVGATLGLNLVEISQALKNYQPLAETKKHDIMDARRPTAIKYEKR
ncbi:MAG: hypothetical protein COT33_00510 [Candidatus Nealsonbacteria bacterium CG08_land_8_20_14_0_20_38_20]|uniref:Mur ligase central domain-containing protein n=1 Tax=Candidatus Nealsonbacteria bacterium CG08_land_8_20_14_0_20_38_20 TaxID=1974705 RepID=A0A2H0YMI7_9BACT|nr:MAG: hypothetical protein COT33_00510 [Candidatus Nealsonbacteria bacterium CG08_land_8_20_14_0_20_38_20]